MDNLKPFRPDTPAEAFRPSDLPYQVGLPIIQDDEDIGLLDDFSDDEEAIDERMIQGITDQRGVLTPYAAAAKAAGTLGIETTKKHANKFWFTAKAWMNPALVGGAIALILGVRAPVLYPLISTILVISIPAFELSFFEFTLIVNRRLFPRCTTHSSRRRAYSRIRSRRQPGTLEGFCKLYSFLLSPLHV